LCWMFPLRWYCAGMPGLRCTGADAGEGGRLAFVVVVAVAVVVVVVVVVVAVVVVVLWSSLSWSSSSSLSSLSSSSSSSSYRRRLTVVVIPSSSYRRCHTVVIVAQARSLILRSCLDELERVGIVQEAFPEGNSGGGGPGSGGSSSSGSDGDADGSSEEVRPYGARCLRTRCVCGVMSVPCCLVAVPRSVVCRTSAPLSICDVRPSFDVDLFVVGGGALLLLLLLLLLLTCPMNPSLLATSIARRTPNTRTTAHQSPTLGRTQSPSPDDNLGGSLRRGSAQSRRPQRASAAEAAVPGASLLRAPHGSQGRVCMRAWWVVIWVG
jgi:hypothetical protein